MTPRKVRLDLVNGRAVRDVDGKKVGHIHDVRVEERGADLVIVEYFLGAAATLERFGIKLGMLVGVGMKREPTRIPWDRLDLSDPERPIFLGKAEELSRGRK